MINVNQLGVFTGRTMDLPFASIPKFTFFPANRAKHLLAAVAIEEAADTTHHNYFEGMNAYGLAAHALYLGQTQYPKNNPSLKHIGAMAWVPYVLQHSKTVKDALKDMRRYQVHRQTFYFHQQPSEALLHLVIEDSSGDSAIVEFIRGKLTIHHSKHIQVITNISFHDQLAAMKTKDPHLYENNATSRALRALTLIRKLQTSKDAEQVVLKLARLMNQLAEPHPLSHDTFEPTRWFVIIEHSQNKIFFYQPGQVTPSRIISFEKNHAVDEKILAAFQPMMHDSFQY